MASADTQTRKKHGECELCGNRTLGRRACIRCEINRPDDVAKLLEDDGDDA